MTFPPVTHVIFDLDGTILDTETVYAQIYETLAAKYHKKYTKDVRLAMTGTKEIESCRIIVNMLKLPITPEEYCNMVNEMANAMMTNPAVKPGAEMVIQHLHSNKIPIAVATSSGKENCDMKTARHRKMFDLFHHIVNGSSDPQVVHGKPAPDIFLICAERFPNSPQPKECLVFEDSANGVLAARAAGMQVVMIPEDYCPVESTKHATLVLKSLEDFVPEDFGLPAYAKK